MKQEMPMWKKVLIFVMIGAAAALAGLALGATLAPGRGQAAPGERVTPSPMWHPPADWKGVQG